MAKVTEDQGATIIGNRLAADLADDIGELKAKAARLYAKFILPIEDEVKARQVALYDAGVRKAIGAKHKVSISESIPWRLDKESLQAEIGEALITKHSAPGAPVVRMTVTDAKPAEAARRAAATVHAQVAA